MDCLFCKIVAGDIPSTKVYEDETVYAFRDIAPQAPTHILVIPKAHIPSVDGITAENSAVVAHIFEVIPAIAKAENLTGGYRVVSNCGADAGQTVHHLHFPILGGKTLGLQRAYKQGRKFSCLDFFGASAIITSDRTTNPSSGSRMQPAEIRLCSLDPRT